MTKFIEIPASKISLAKRKLLYGIGVNDSTYKTSIKLNGKNRYCPCYVKWTHMLERCYSNNLKIRRPSYIDVTVCDEWLLFSDFKKWMELQEHEHKELDKDLKILGNKIYSPDACLFITRRINLLITDSGTSRGEYKIGVSMDRQSQKYRTQCRDATGKQKHLGLYPTEEHAHQAYRKYKKKVIIEISNLPENELIKQYLINYSNSI